MNILSRCRYHQQGRFVQKEKIKVELARTHGSRRRGKEFSSCERDHLVHGRDTRREGCRENRPDQPIYDQRMHKRVRQAKR